MKRVIKLACALTIFLSGTSAFAAEIKACDTAECTNYFKQYKKYARVGHSQAMVTLGELYFHGYGVPKDLDNALRYFKRSAKYGRVQGMNKAGILYLTEPSLLDIDEGLKYLKKAARKSHASSALLLGVIYYNDGFGPKDIEQADKWLAVSYKRGYQELKQYVQEISNLKGFTAQQFPQLFEMMAEYPISNVNEINAAKDANQNDSQIVYQQASSKTLDTKRAYANKVSWPKDGMEVIEVTAPNLQEIFDNELLTFKSVTPDRHLSQAGAGSNIIGVTCEYMVSCNNMSKEEFLRIRNVAHGFGTFTGPTN